jgi:hypothetical protein
LITHNKEVSVHTAEIDTAKLYWNGAISTKGAKYMCLDIKNFCLTALLKYFKYMHIPLLLFLAWTVEQHNFAKLVLDRWVHIEMQQAVWGLPQAGILANKWLQCKLAPFGYYESVNTPHLWYHESQLISFILIVNNFGIEYASQDYVDHFISSIKKTYTLTEDWMGNLFFGITLEWDYDCQMVDISMPGYIIKKLQEYEHSKPFKVQNCLCTPKLKKFGTEAQAPLGCAFLFAFLFLAFQFQESWGITSKFLQKKGIPFRVPFSSRVTFQEFLFAGTMFM